MSVMYQDLSKYKFTLDRGRSKVIILLYRIVYVVFIRFTPSFMWEWRNILYRTFGAKIGKRVRIAPDVKILYPWKVSIGNYVWIGDGSNLYSVDSISIGNNVSISFNVFLATANHNIYDITFPTTSAPIYIEDECWISTNVLILQGVRVHRGSVVSACSLVTKDIPKGVVAVGIPAVPKRTRNKAKSFAATVVNENSAEKKNS